MRALVLLSAAAGLTLLVFWFWREQMRGRVEPMPPLVAQLERLVEEGALGGESPESLVATLVFSEPFREADPWDLAPRRRGAMQAWFGEPRELAFLGALLREPRTAGWRLESAEAGELSRAEAEAAAAAAWAAEKGARLRVVAHGAALVPVLRAALAAPPVFERVLGVGVSLADIKPRDPALFAALAQRQPAAEWLDLYSDPAVVPRSLVLERVGPGPAAAAEEVAWPGTSWVALAVDLAARGRPSAPQALPAPTGAALMSARQFRSVKDGKVTTRVVDGKGQVVTGSLVVPKLDKEEIPPDPEAGEKKPGGEGAPGELLPLGPTGWSLRKRAEFASLSGKDIPCVGSRVLVQEGVISISVSCFRAHADAPEKALEHMCSSRPANRVLLKFKGRPAGLCKQMPPAREFRDGSWSDTFEVAATPYAISLVYNYPGEAARAARLDLFEKAIESLEPPAGK